ncbi:D-glycerate dehydrogenase [Chitinophaga alhagiae]|uniref:D-glycerate dehydrogenase n=1 Tax=Chitinophaga alhagiae TaxID=2203219 RepID=A0ABN5LRJ7_9BACT|nr:D-glycerate dehydrogenase [Chitinophaga alhagiae]AWO02046.1 D-glycerate dehydrogenase [Chitinophaga alhagiae]
MKAFVTRKIPDVGLQLLRAAGVEVTAHTEKRELAQEELITACLRHDALLSVGGRNKIDAVFLNACSHLKVVSLMSVGYDNVDVVAARELGIPIGHTPGVLSNATADTAFLLMMAVARKAFYLHNTIARGEWGFFEPTRNLGVELNGKTLGVFGLGKIGMALARKCRGAYDMPLIYHNRGRNEAAEQELGARWVPFDELLRESDVLSLHAALTPETKGLFNEAAFGKMKQSSIFINTARGAMHNEQHLLRALQEEQIWGAGLDVTNPEPMDPDNPLLNMPNVAVLPHIGSATVEARNGMAVMAAQNLIAGLKGEPLPFAVKG